MPKRKIDWNNPWAKEKEVMKLGHHIGVKQEDFYDEDMGSAPDFDRDGYAKAVERAYNNNYDVRRSLEAARLSGKDNIPNNIGSIEDAYNAHKFMKRTHHNKIGNAEKYDYDEMAGVTNYWVKKDRNDLKDDMNKQMESMIDAAKWKPEDDEEKENDGPIENSERLSGAKTFLQNSPNNSSLLYANDDDDYELNRFEANNESAPKINDQNDGARNFLDNNKIDVAQGMNLQNDTLSNLSSAANYVTNIYGR